MVVAIKNLASHTLLSVNLAHNEPLLLMLLCFVVDAKQRNEMQFKSPLKEHTLYPFVLLSKQNHSGESQNMLKYCAKPQLCRLLWLPFTRGRPNRASA